MGARRMAWAGRWAACVVVPVALVLASLLAEDSWLIAGATLVAVPLGLLLALPVALRSAVARRRAEPPATAPFARATFAVWAGGAAFLLAFAVGRSTSWAAVTGLALLALAWVAQLVTAWFRATPVVSVLRRTP